MKNLNKKKDNYINNVIFENIILNHYENYYYTLGDDDIY
jgi:hypothetical protein